MLFNSFVFLLVFLPITLAGFYWLGNRFGQQQALLWLVVASLTFYASWRSDYLWVLLASLLFNYVAAGWIAKATRGRKWILIGALSTNVGLLFYYKLLIAGFIGASALQNQAFSTEYNILIPLGISFITFQKIALLVDTYKGRLGPVKPLEYCLFVTFFPQLIMGPIVHYREFEPQLRQHSFLKWNPDNFSVGMTILIIGLFKKVVLADGIAPHVNTVYELIANGGQVNSMDSWCAAIGFSFQLYFDFSGYADMAIGLARMFNINLPINFDSPYRAIDRFDYWRRWHISFGAFMRQYVFFPLARARKLKIGNVGALAITTLLSGLWHGVGETFILWGAVQSILMIALHYRDHLLEKLGLKLSRKNLISLLLKMFATFFITVLLGVLFRSNNMHTVAMMYASMLTGISALMTGQFSIQTADLQHTFTRYDLIKLAVMGIIIWGLPNTQIFFAKFWTAIDQRSHKPEKVIADLLPGTSKLKFTLTRIYASITVALLLTVLLHMTQPSRFIYYQF